MLLIFTILRCSRVEKNVLRSYFVRNEEERGATFIYVAFLSHSLVTISDHYFLSSLQFSNFISNLSSNIFYYYRPFFISFVFHANIIHFSFSTHHFSRIFYPIPITVLKALLGDALSTLTEQMGIDMKSELMSNPQSMKDVQVCSMLCVRKLS